MVDAAGGGICAADPATWSVVGGVGRSRGRDGVGCYGRHPAGTHLPGPRWSACGPCRPVTVTAGVYFGASIVLSVIAHDAFGMVAGQFGFIIAAPGFAWAIAGLWMGLHPAGDDRSLRERLLPGGIVLGAGVAVLLATTLLAQRTSSAFAGLLVGAALLGVGMGSVYTDLLGRCLAQPEPTDGISVDRMAAAVVLAETVGMTVSTTLAYTLLGNGFGLTNDPVLRAGFLYLGLLPVAVVMLHRLWSATRPAPKPSPRPLLSQQRGIPGDRRSSGAPGAGLDATGQPADSSTARSRRA
jgi:hypothetical protein